MGARIAVELGNTNWPDMYVIVVHVGVCLDEQSRDLASTTKGGAVLF